MDSGNFLRELKIRAIEMYEFLLEEGEGGLVEKSVEQALEQASAELSMQSFQGNLDSLGGGDVVRDILRVDMAEFHKERLAWRIGKIQADELTHPGNIAKAALEARKKAVTDRDHMQRSLGYHEAMLRWARFPVSIPGDEEAMTRKDCVDMIAYLREKLKVSAPTYESYRDIVARIYDK